MNDSPSVSAPRRQVWRWVFLGLGIVLTPFVVLAIAAASFITLDRDAAVLRKHVMAATHSSWNTKVQLSIGRMTLGTVRTCLGFVHHKDVADARLALAAVRHASVGVYECNSRPAAGSRGQLFTDTDQAMQQRGWTRLVGVADKGESVLVYVPQAVAPDEPIDICVAVVSGKELVVVSTSVDATALAELVQHHTADDMKGHLRLAKYRF